VPANAKLQPQSETLHGYGGSPGKARTTGPGGANQTVATPPKWGQIRPSFSCLAGLDSLTSGQIFLGQVELSTLSDKEITILRREQVGSVFQSFNVMPTLSAREKITLPHGLGRHPP